MEKRFKNSFGVQSDSVPLLEAFIKEVEALGWKRSSSGNHTDVSETNKIYFGGWDEGDSFSLKPGYYWFPDSDSDALNLPSDWDKALALASEIVEEEVNPFKVGDWVYHKDTKTTYQITGFDEDNWCLGDVDGNGWEHTQLKKATKAQIAKFTGVVTRDNCKVGDVVVLIDNRCGSCNSIGSVGTIIEKDSETCRVSANQGASGNWSYYMDLRKATAGEAAGAPSIKIIRFAGTDFIVTKGKDFAETDRGNVSKAEIQKVLRLFDAKMSICGYDLKIEDVDNIRISFGCQTDTVGKARQILAAFDGEVELEDLPF